jgi:hypothetical protein
MANFSLPIVPFTVPDKVTLQMPAGKRQDGMRPPVELSLEQLDDETLGALIEEFAAAVMAKAGRST